MTFGKIFRNSGRPWNLHEAENHKKELVRDDKEL